MTVSHQIQDIPKEREIIKKHQIKILWFEKYNNWNERVSTDLNWPKKNHQTWRYRLMTFYNLRRREKGMKKNELSLRPALAMEYKKEERKKEVEKISRKCGWKLLMFDEKHYIFETSTSSGRINTERSIPQYIIVKMLKYGQREKYL